MERYGYIDEVTKQPTGEFYYHVGPLEERLQDKISVLPVVVVDERKNPIFYDRMAPFLTIEDGKILETFPYLEKVNLAQVKIDFLADIRWRAESGGCAWNEWMLLTDERSRSNYQAELAAVHEAVRVDGDLWKFPHGFEPLSNDQVRGMVVAARQHVLSCFAAEAIVASQIGAIPAEEGALKNAFDFALNAVKGGSFEEVSA